MSFFKKIFSKEKKETLDKGLEKTKESFFGKLTKAVAGKSKVDENVLDKLEEVLVASDVGVNTTLKISQTRLQLDLANMPLSSPHTLYTTSNMIRASHMPRNERAL